MYQKWVSHSWAVLFALYLEMLANNYFANAVCVHAICMSSYPLLFLVLCNPNFWFFDSYLFCVIQCVCTFFSPSCNALGRFEVIKWNEMKSTWSTTQAAIRATSTRKLSWSLSVELTVWKIDFSREQWTTGIFWLRLLQMQPQRHHLLQWQNNFFRDDCRRHIRLLLLRVTWFFFYFILFLMAVVVSCCFIFLCARDWYRLLESW